MVTIPGYRLDEKIYEDSKTLVYRAKSIEGRTVAIELLKNPYPDITEILRLRNHYQITKKLDLSGIVRSYALEKTGNSLALIREDFQGTWLENVIKKKIKIADFLKIGIELAEIIKQIHDRGIIHKQIEPNNIIINHDFQVKLTNFKIASYLPREEINQFQVIEEKIKYLSPEQTGRMNRTLDYRTDFYSLGVTFYKLLTGGKLPWTLSDSNDPMEIVHCHIARQPNPLDKIDPAIPQTLNDIVLKLMAKNPEERYQTALGLKYDLQKCLEEWIAKGSISQFAIGKRDICDRFKIPEKLYGRKKEISILLAAFARISSLSSDLVGKSEKEEETRRGLQGGELNSPHSPSYIARGLQGNDVSSLPCKPRLYCGEEKSS